MTPAIAWNGDFQATGGNIIVREDRGVLCYQIYNHNVFQEHLFNSTRLAAPNTSRYDFGTIYKENGNLFKKLNLQVRFV